MTHHYVTYTDRNYLIRAIALAKSLQRHETKTWQLFVICLDQITFQILHRLNLPGVTPVPLDQYELGDVTLQAIKPTRSKLEYYWTLTPTLILRTLENLPGGSSLVYLDADLYFYSNPEPIFKELAGQSVLIHEHRYSPELAHLERESGRFNVGLIAVHKDQNSVAVLQWWRERCLEWCYRRYENGKMGDQKYLEKWPQLFKGITITQNHGLGAAPWNASRYEWSQDSEQILLNNLPLVFYHFHALEPIRPGLIRASNHAAYPLPESALKLIYRPYVEVLDQVDQQIKKLEPRFTFGYSSAAASSKGSVLLEKHTSGDWNGTWTIRNECPQVSSPPFHGEEDALLFALQGHPVSQQIRTLYFVGAHEFQEHALLKHIFPNLSKVILFEPLPKFYHNLQSRLKGNDQYKVLPYALSNKNESAPFYVTNNSASSSLHELGKHLEIFPHVRQTETIQVECRTLESVMRQHDLPPPDMLFLDVQGAEYNILEAIPKALRDEVPIIYTEASHTEIYKESRSLDALNSLLGSSHNFLGFAPLAPGCPEHGNALFLRKGIATDSAQLSKPSVSILIITNAGLPGQSHRYAYLERLLASIQCAGFPAQTEVLVIGAVGKSWKGVRTLEQPELAQTGQVCAMRNVGITESSGELVVHCDDDILFTPEYWETLAKYNQRTDWEILCTRLLNPNGTRYWDWAAHYPGKGQTLLPYTAKDEYVYATGGHGVYRRKIFSKVRWNESFKHGQNEEFDFAAQARKAGLKYAFAHEGLVFLQYSHCDAMATITGSQPQNPFAFCTEYQSILGRLPIPNESYYYPLRHKLIELGKPVLRQAVIQDNIPKVSILVACHRFLQRFKVFSRTLCAQDYPLENLEIVVANPESPDGLSTYLRVLKQASEGKPNVLEVLAPADKSHNRGYLIQRAFEASSGEIIIGMDGDLVLPRHFLKRLIPLVQEHKNRMLGVYRQFLTPATTGKVLAGMLDPIRDFQILAREDQQEEQGYRGVLGYCQALTRPVWSKVGYPEEFNSIAQSDVTFSERLAQHGVTPLFRPELRVLHLHHKRNWNGTEDFL